MFEIREDLSPKGPKKLVAEHHHYLDLVAKGRGTAETCRAVGTNRRTGASVEVRTEEPGRTTGGPTACRLACAGERRFLSLDERIVIADLLRAGSGCGRSRPNSTGRRPRSAGRPNATPILARDYRPHTAQDRADKRRPCPKTRKIAACFELHDLLQGTLNDRCSPEQISRRLRRDHPDRPELHVTHETIYQPLYLQDRGKHATN